MALKQAKRLAAQLSPGFVLGEFIRYAAASALALVIDFSLLIALTEWAGWHYLLSAAAGFIAGSVCLYLLCVNLIFRKRRFEDRTSEFTIFVVIGLLGLGLTQVLMFTFVSLGAPYPLAKAETAAVTFLFNFGMRKVLLFQVSRLNRSAK